MKIKKYSNLSILLLTMSGITIAQAVNNAAPSTIAAPIEKRTALSSGRKTTSSMLEVTDAAAPLVTSVTSVPVVSKVTVTKEEVPALKASSSSNGMANGRRKKKKPAPSAVASAAEPASAFEEAAPLVEMGEQATSATPYLSSFLKPWDIGDPDELLEFNFENTELSTILGYIEKRYQVSFLLDDNIKPLPEGGKSIIGSKVTFRTHKPLTKKQAWDTFITFLDMVGVAPVPGPKERSYIIKSTAPSGSDKASPVAKSPLPTFIGTDIVLLPDNDTRIRYVYFVENTDLNVVKDLFDKLRSGTAPVAILFPDYKAILMTDKASNIRSMVSIIKDLDKVNMPEMLAVVKLKHADATMVAKLYEDLVQEETKSQTLADRLRRKQPTATYFSEYTRVKAEPRTNSLILLGTKENVNKVIGFIKKEIDRDPALLPSPLYVYQLKYGDAETIATILKDVIQFKANPDAAKFGGVRDGDRYFKSTVTITPEKSGNRLVINANQDDYQKIKELLDKIDIELPQVAIKVLILSVDLTDNKQFGVQLRNKVPGPLPTNINAQTSGLAGTRSSIVEDPTGTGATRLLGDLIALAAGNEVGSTLITLGSDAFGVWGLLKMLQTYSKVSVVANPFLIATHKYQSIISIGVTRRVVAAVVKNTTTDNSIEDLSANLEVKLTPQISVGDGLTTLDVLVTLNNFTTDDPMSGNRNEKVVQTAVIVGNNETLALGGLIKDTITESETQVPLLGAVPVLGWLFKNKVKQIIRSSLIILITPEIIPPETHAEANKFTSTKFSEMRALRNGMIKPSEQRDPIHRWFFKDGKEDKQQFEEQVISEFVDTNQRYDAHVQTEDDKRQVIELYQPQVLAKSMVPSRPITCKPKQKKLSSMINEQGVPA